MSEKTTFTGCHRVSTALEWIGCSMGVSGAALVAAGMDTIWLGFAAFLASNLAWILFALSRKASGLLTMQLVFTVTSVMGLIRYW